MSMSNGWLEVEASFCSTSIAAIFSARRLLRHVLGIGTEAGMVAARLAEEQRDEDYVPLGNRQRAKPQPPPDQHRLATGLTTFLVGASLLLAYPSCLHASLGPDPAAVLCLCCLAPAMDWQEFGVLKRALLIVASIAGHWRRPQQP